MSTPSPLILIVEDEPATRDSLVLVLGDEGYRCRSSSDGAGALRLLEEEAVDLVLLDLATPFPGTGELFYSLHRLRPGLPVLLLSFYEDRERLSEMLRRGASGYLFKPIDFEELIDSIPGYLGSC